MRDLQVQGVVPALLTPFLEDESIDFKGLEELTTRLSTIPGVGAIFATGHAGEVAALSREERREVVGRVCRIVDGRMPVFAGVYTDSLKEAIALTADAQNAGADAITLFPPPIFADGGCEDERMPLAWVTGIVEATGVRVVIFQLDGNLAYTPETLRLLCEIPNVVAVKEGSSDLVAYQRNVEICAAAAPPVPVLTSNNSWLYPSLVVGGEGILSGSSSVLASLHVELWEAVRARNMEAAAILHNSLYPLVKCFYRRPFIDMHTRMKVCLWLMGVLESPTVRKPLLPIEPAEVDILRSELVRLGML